LQRHLSGRGGTHDVRKRGAWVWRMLTRARTIRSIAFAAVLTAVSFASRAVEAREGTVLRGARTPVGYTVEIEPHLIAGSSPPGSGFGSGAGLGLRASWVLAPDGFIDGVNDSIALGFGLDFGHYSAAYALNGYRDQCRRFEDGPAGTSVCTDVTSNGGTYNYLFLPVVMQWNFWFTERWSAFGEPGINLYYLGNHGVAAGPALYLGGRFRLAERITLTLRIGYPTLGLGVSFMM
jgi:hypothetical protein